MALTVVKYKKPQRSDGVLVRTSKIVSPTITSVKRPLVQIERGSGGGIVINKIQNEPKIMKRNSITTFTEPAFKTAKIGGKQISLQSITSAGTPLTTIDGKLYSIQQNSINTGSTGAGIAINNKKHRIIRSSDGTNILTTTNTPIKLSAPTENKQFAIPFIQHNGVLSSSATGGVGIRRPTIYIKREIPKKTIRSVTTELIERNPHTHLGVTSDRLGILKNVVCTTANVSVIDLYITLKKLRQNEDFSLLAEYFEFTESEVQKIFTRTIVKLAKYMKFLIRWPESKRYYDRHKSLPIAFRSKLSSVQSLIECVETEIQPPTTYPSVGQLQCTNYKFIFTISPNGVISYVSDAYLGNNDDLTIFSACEFHNVIPKYLSLVADPGKAIRRRSRIVNAHFGRKEDSSIDSKPINKQEGDTNSKIVLLNGQDTDSMTDSADEGDENVLESNTNVSTSVGCFPQSTIIPSTTSHQTLNIVNSELISKKVKNFSIPTVRVREAVCRQQIRQMLFCLREFKVLQPYAILEPMLYQYINEILVVTSALTNLQR